MSYFTEMGALLNEAMNMKDDRLRRDKKESTLNESVEKKEVAEKKPAKKANYWSQAANKLDESLYDKVNDNVNKFVGSEDSMAKIVNNKLDSDPNWKDVKADSSHKPEPKEERTFDNLYDKVDYNVNKY